MTAMVEWPVRSLRASTSPNVESGVTLESLRTKPDLHFFTARTMAAWLSMLWDTKMKETPPSRARAAASFSPDTDCITAETRGMFMDRAGASFIRYLQRGVTKLTFCGVQAEEEYPGTSSYSEKVWDGSLK